MKPEQIVSPIYQVWEGELLIEAPIQTVWANILNYPAWQNFPVMKCLSGERGEEGELVLLRKEEEGFTFPAYYARTVKVEHVRRIIWKVYLDKGAENYDFFGFVDFRVDEQKDKTRFSYNLIYEFVLDSQDPGEIDRFREQQYLNFKALVSVIIPNLKKLSETGSL